MFAEEEEEEEVLDGGEEHPLRRKASSSMGKGNHGEPLLLACLCFSVNLCKYVCTDCSLLNENLLGVLLLRLGLTV